jgi:hypothetical protein
MPDVVVTVPARLWPEWLDEGDCAGDPRTGRRYSFWVFGFPDIEPDERVYVVALGKLRGFAPLDYAHGMPSGRVALVRAGGAEAVTIPRTIRGFRGYRYRWWDRSEERPFPDWRKP